MSYVLKLESILSDVCEKNGWDFGIEFKGGYDYAWSGELRITKKPNDHGHIDVSEVYYVAGKSGPEDAARTLWEKFKTIT